MKEIVKKMLKERGVTIEDMANLVYELQKDYADISIETAIFNIEKVLSKREVQNAILTGIQLDILAEKNLLKEPLLSMIKKDEPLYGIDEILALSITNVYGSIGFTNYGYIDKMKFGIIGKLDKLGKTTDRVNTFLDDLVGGIVAAACARITHSNKE
ncbi:Phosphatidylglycerophosphatase A [Caloranaerobacter azorensis DSM 13643]|uniref:Phosphatidylglycerophosphatase A n=2 Tax=Caloranaerobacter azorensis TaxID=116090 RepID=A0A1M5W1M6_9FIRM|nr:phosphatidylglycerophosphatase A [Caloranaerobacter azorensis]SHH81479.1 Phosphatidylglycerophosphatase A [Caloranaerobacter azorensis DSM 13643]